MKPIPSFSTIWPFVCALAFILVNVNISYAYLYNTQRLVNDLPHVNVLDISQTPNGIIWIATEGGLCSYNGVDFSYFKQSSGLPSNAVQVVKPDQFGNLWVGTQRGVSIIRDNKVVHTIPATLEYDVVKIVHGFPYVYIHTKDRFLHTYDMRSGEFVGEPLEQIHGVSAATDSGIWIVSVANGLQHKKGSRISQSELVMPDYNSMYAPVDFGSHLIFCHNQVFYYWSKGTDPYEIKIDKPVSVGINAHFYKDSKNNLWVWSISDKGTIFKLDFVSPDVAQKVEIQSGILAVRFFEDKNGDIWIPTYGTGALIFRPDKYGDESFNKSLGYINVISLYKDSTFSLIGTGAGLFDYNKPQSAPVLLDEDGFRIKYIRKIIRSKNIFYISNTSSNIPINEINDPSLGKVYEIFAWTLEIKGDSLFAYQGNNVFTVYDISNGQPLPVKQVDMPVIEKGTFSVKDIFFADSYILLATNKGLYIYDDKFNFLNVLFKGENIYKISRINQAIFVGGSNGLLSIYKRNNKYSALRSRSFSNLLVYALEPINNSTLAIGTSNGLFIWGEDGCFAVDETDNLFAGHVYYLKHSYLDSMLYIGANNGLYKISSKTLDRTNFKLPPQTQIVLAKADNTFRFQNSDNVIIEQSGQAEGLQISYTAFDYFDANSTTFRYRLNAGPLTYTKSRQLTYNSLWPGLYTLSVEASVNGIEWGEKSELSFEVRPKIWQRPIFIVFGILFLLSLGWLIIRIRIQRVKDKSKKLITYERSINSFKLQALNSAINSHFLFSVLNSIGYFIRLGDKEKAGDLLGTYARFIRQSLDYSDKLYVPFSVEIDRVVKYVELKRLKHDEYPIDFQIKNEESIDFTQVLIPNLLLQPLVENAIIHGLLPAKRGGFVFIEISKSGSDSLLVCIEDNGLGFKNSIKEKVGLDEPKRSLSLSNIENRLQILFPDKETSIHIENYPSDSEPGKTGTKVCIQFPFLKQNKS